MLRPTCAASCATPPPLAVCPPPLFCRSASDTVDCRFLLNDALAEIERLRREIAGLEVSLHSLRPPQACEASRPIDSTLVDLSKATSARRAYAVAPIGEVRFTPPSTPLPPPLPPSRITSVVTNLGTMMDVLI